MSETLLVPDQDFGTFAGPVAMSRFWAMPTANTFDAIPIHNFVWKYLANSRVSVDPFARNKTWATYSNDLNPKTEAAYHLEAEEFLSHLVSTGVRCDLLIFDPPYSPRQQKESYEAIGRAMQLEDGQTARLRKIWRDAAYPLLTNDAVVLSFGWNSVGYGKSYGFVIEEIMLVCHGSDHNDTICMAERRKQGHLFA